MLPARNHAVDHQLPVLMPIANTGRNGAEDLQMHHARKLAKGMLHSLAVRLYQAKAHIVTLHGVPLKLQHLAHAVTETVRHDQNPGCQGKTCHREKGLHGLALQIANGDAEAVGKPPGDSSALNNRGTVVRRRLRAHGIGGG